MCPRFHILYCKYTSDIDPDQVGPACSVGSVDLHLEVKMKGNAEFNQQFIFSYHITEV